MQRIQFGLLVCALTLCAACSKTHSPPTHYSLERDGDERYLLIHFHDLTTERASFTEDFEKTYDSGDVLRVTLEQSGEGEFRTTKYNVTWNDEMINFKQ